MAPWTAGIDRAISDPLLRQIFAYWQAKAAKRGALPARADIDPVDLANILPAISLIEVRRDAANRAGRLRYRVVGSLHVEIMGRDATGELIDLSAADDGAAAAAVATGRPVHAQRTFNPANGVALMFETLICPLAADGVTVDMLLCAVAPHYQPKDLPAARVNRFARRSLAGLTSFGC
ncbi:PAS domain-containing protein [Dongia deserti]|uniref:PAS domain-containing protein n=1 Tax=Dongia deserti TaxID=2268030 RepID=UPI000E655BEC|nr:PAS domain-containing protein [Dongia deserti]